MLLAAYGVVIGFLLPRYPDLVLIFFGIGAALECAVGALCFGRRGAVVGGPLGPMLWMAVIYLAWPGV